MQLTKQVKSVAESLENPSLCLGASNLGDSPPCNLNNLKVNKQTDPSSLSGETPSFNASLHLKRYK